ncbi:hypothetical protein J3F83DRAFT_661352 [Trichoderma novae-zelandiae]
MCSRCGDCMMQMSLYRAGCRLVFFLLPAVIVLQVHTCTLPHALRKALKEGPTRTGTLGGIRLTLASHPRRQTNPGERRRSSRGTQTTCLSMT